MLIFHYNIWYVVFQIYKIIYVINSPLFRWNVKYEIL